jgi:hypothetical protein
LFVTTISFTGVQIIEKSASPDGKFSVEVGNQLTQGDLSGTDHHPAEPGLLHLFEPRFRILSFTGKRMTHF